MEPSDDEQYLSIQLQQIVDDTSVRGPKCVEKKEWVTTNGKAVKREVESLDPADYLLEKTKYHDCHLTVGNPDTGDVKVFGIVRSHLVAHSTVFRDIVEDNKLADPLDLKMQITDVDPEVFRLILIHVYGGELPSMSRETAAQLVICADKYNIQPLVTKACRLLIPTSMAELVPALYCVSCVTLPDLLPLVTEMVQQQTEELVACNEFLDVDTNCLEFLARQDKLAITELELWRSLVRWVQKKADGAEDLRLLVDKVLKHIRLITFTQDQIIEEVIPANILRPEEVIDLLSAVSSGKSLTSPGLCSLKQDRQHSKNEKSQFLNTFTFNTDYYLNYKNTYFKKEGTFNYSNFIIKTLDESLELESFRFKAPYFKTVSVHYNRLFCINIHKCTDGFIQNTETIEQRINVIDKKDLIIPLKLQNGEFVRLEKNSSYNISINSQLSYPAYSTFYSYNKLWIGNRVDVDTTREERITSDFKIKFKSPLHVDQITYKM